MTALVVALATNDLSGWQAIIALALSFAFLAFMMWLFER